MPFNEEIVVRAFADSKVPIISAVGHQIDHPLSDAAADKYAPTPSAAAEIAIPQKQELAREIDYLLTRSETALITGLQQLEFRLATVRSRRIFQKPYEIVLNREMQVSDCEMRISRHVTNCISEARKQYYSLANIKMLTQNLLREKKHAFSMALQAMEQLSPAAVLRRGYAIARDAQENVIRSVDNVQKEDEINVSFHDGTVHCKALFITKGVCYGK